MNLRFLFKTILALFNQNKNYQWMGLNLQSITPYQNIQLHRVLCTALSS